MYDLVKNVIQIFQLVTIQSIWRYQAVGLIGKKGDENCGCEIWFNPSRICLIWPLYFPQQGNQIRQIEEITFPNLQTPVSVGFFWFGHFKQIKMKKSHFLIFRPVSLRENYWVFHCKINDVKKEKSPSSIEYWLMLSFLWGQNWWENLTKPVCSVPESEFGCLQHATIHQKGANILGNVNTKGARHQVSTNCGILPSWMVEHGVSVENLEKLYLWYKALYLRLKTL